MKVLGRAGVSLFFFQAEDGIRDVAVTGVQTCALPILADSVGSKVTYFLVGLGLGALVGVLFAPKAGDETRDYLSKKADEGKDYAQRKARSEERRVGKEGRSRWSPYH